MWKCCSEVCPSGVPLPALSPVLSAKGSGTSPPRFLHPPAPGCCRRWELGSDFNATRRLHRVSHCARSCYQRHKRKKALLTFSYVTQSNSSTCGFFVLLGRRERRGDTVSTKNILARISSEGVKLSSNDQLKSIRNTYVISEETQSKGLMLFSAFTNDPSDGTECTLLHSQMKANWDK
ncbi:hypothetical protein QYF61_026274 [Mycteria americana]|uniref:Uncharacterized protein n=1 Tax=Mycteria americana TaxID=33587 RepID=A0AAN7NJ39_MYCAM|nr:hypothetical protein QYF61_026274 [Mycteria americana]